MDRSAAQVTSTFQLTAEVEDENGGWQPANEHFAYRPVSTRVPRALWGDKLQQDLIGERYVENVLSSLELVSGATRWIARYDLQSTTAHVESGVAFEPLTIFQSSALGSDEDAAGYLRAHLSDSATMGNGRELLTTLGFDYDRLGLQLMPAVIDALVMSPQIGDLV